MKVVVITSHDNRYRSVMEIADDAPEYFDLLVENDKLKSTIMSLKATISELQQQNQDTWSTLEDIACGATIECPSCGKSRPCLCQDAK